MSEPNQSPFWERPLDELNDDEWEQLCDGCGQCCLLKLEDEETHAIYKTGVVCRYFQTDCGRCSVYPQRHEKKPDCFVIERGNPLHMTWLPDSCAYRRRFHGQALPDWHPLISGSRKAMMAAGIAIDDGYLSDEMVDEDELDGWVIGRL